ncbi:MAG TPA: type II secretion system F family protein [Bacteroidia bacterium]|nr:type II secretion system F family protein [Bacteroidia bacterium]
MNWFEYTATTGAGDSVQGRLRAESAEALRWMLLERGMNPGAIREAASGGRPALAPSEWIGARSVHVELTLRQIAVMLRSGLTLLSAVETVIEQPPSRAVRRVYEAVRDRVEGGSAFAEALAGHKCFPSGVVSMIGMGEESGNLDTVIEQAAVSMETRRRNRSATVTALFYPTFTFLFAIAICIYMVVAVIPPMKKALESLGRKLPAMTQSLLDAADFFSKWGLHLVVVAVVLLVALVLTWLWPPGRLAIDRFLLRVPLIGKILRTGATALFARSMRTLLGSGIPLVEGLRIVAGIHGNRYLAAVIESARRRILEGGTLAGSLSRPHAYTPMMLKMVGVGEASGNLEETLEHAAEFHEDQLQALIKRLSALLEPAIVLVVGALVGYVYIAFFVGLYGAM